MAMTKTEIAAIENVIRRLKEPRCGGADPFPDHHAKLEYQVPGYEGVSRIYLNTWIIGALECLLPGEDHDPKLARDLSSR